MTIFVCSCLCFGPLVGQGIGLINISPPVSYQRSVKTQELPKNRDNNCPRIEGGCAFSMSSLLSSVRAARQRGAARTTLAVAMPTAGRSSPVGEPHLRRARVRQRRWRRRWRVVVASGG